MDWKGLVLGIQGVSLPSDLSGSKLGVPSQLSPTGLFYKGTKDTFFSLVLNIILNLLHLQWQRPRILLLLRACSPHPLHPCAAPPIIALSTLMGVGVPV